MVPGGGVTSNCFYNNSFTYPNINTTFTNVATSVPVKNSPKLMQNNSVSFGAKEEIENNQGMSKGAKWTIGLGLTALAGVGIYIATKGKVGKQTTKELEKLFKENLNQVQLAEYLEKQEFTDINKAKDFIINQLKIKEVDEDIPIDILNEIIKGLVDVSNAHKGKLFMPRSIRYVHAKGNVNASVCTDITDKSFMDLQINRDIYNRENLLKELNKYIDKNGKNVFRRDSLKYDGVEFKPKEELKEFAANLDEQLKTDNVSTYDLIRFYITQAHITDILNRKKYNPLIMLNELKTKLKLDIDIEQIAKQGKEEQGKMIEEILNTHGKSYALGISNPNLTIWHEMGHVQDIGSNYKKIYMQNSGNDLISRANRFLRKKDYVALPDEDKKLVKEYAPEFIEFINNQEMQNTAGKVSLYAQQGIGEFIAETYARLVEKCIPPNDVMALYKKYNGPQII